MAGETVGRSSAFTSELLTKLEEGFLRGYNNRQACIYADISETAFYRFLEEHPDFVERMEKLKENDVMKAKVAIHDVLNEKRYTEPNKRLDITKWYLERKAKDEFGTRYELTGADGGPIKTELSLSDEQYRKLIAREANRLEAGGEQPSN